MRELTKSVLRFSWAMPLFGIRQVSKLALPSGANQGSAAKAFDAVNKTAQSQLGSGFESLFTAGDQLQRGVVDAVFGLLFLDQIDPARLVPGGAAPAPPGGSSAPATSPAPPGAAGGAAPAPASQLGWGPMPS